MDRRSATPGMYKSEIDRGVCVVCSLDEDDHVRLIVN